MSVLPFSAAFRRLSVRLSSRAGAAALLTGSAGLLAGCSGALTSTPVTPSSIAVSGNWQISSSAAAAVHLPALSGAFSGTSAAITAIVHADAATACWAPSAAVVLTGSADAARHVTMTGATPKGGLLTLTGTLAADGRSLSNAAYNVTGGSCAFARPADATAVQYADITGTYNGTFYDADSSTTPVVQMTAQLSQSPAGDTNGDFTLTGSANVGSQPCFSNPTQVTSSQVTGGSFTMTYTDPQSGAQVTASGTFSTDGKTLTITQWTLSGPCGPDSGYGTMVKQ